MATHGSTGILESVSFSAINKLHPFHPASKKRKLRQSYSEEILTPLLDIKLQTFSKVDTALSLEPHILLPRSLLPLSWLDGPAGSPPSQPSNFFISNIPDLENDLSSCKELTVLIARLACSGAFHVVERVKRGVYALSSLAHWVDEGDLFALANQWHAQPQVSPSVEGGAACYDVDWRQAAKIDDQLLESQSIAKFMSLDIAIAFGANQTNNTHPAVAEDVSGLSSRHAPGDEHCEESFVHTLVDRNESIPNDVRTPPEVGREGGTEIAKASQSSEELLDALKIRYLEALYVSKTSVAYFAKGPLARCRVAFQPSDSESAGKPSELASFYRNIILPVKKMDIKYRETLPGMIRSIALVMSEDEGARHSRKRRGKKKGKIGKDALYLEEERLIRRWWKGRPTTEALGLTEAEEMKRHIADLRLRETQLQVLLILETIALETSTYVTSRAFGDGNPQHVQKPKQANPERLQDLNVLLELLLDRLCIWHAVNADDPAIADSAKGDGKGPAPGKTVESDALRDFYTEIIIPFYASRLPEQCNLIKRKLPGTHLTSPPRPTVPGESSSRTQSSGAVKRPKLHKARRTLQRVLTDEKMATSQKARHPTLTRSSTAPSVQEIKRESVEPSLPSLNLHMRGGIQKPKRADNREVDLNEVAKQQKAKLQKMNMLMKQKKELDAAINALRKPNRELIAKEIAESAERRISSGSCSRKPKHPVWNPLATAQGIQVMATPTKAMKKDASNAFIELPPATRCLVTGPVLPHQQLTPSPPNQDKYTDVPLVPGSIIRPSYRSHHDVTRMPNELESLPTSSSFSSNLVKCLLNDNRYKHDDDDDDDELSMMIHETPSKGKAVTRQVVVSQRKEAF